MYDIILASGSPRRKEIMDTMEIRYRVVTADVEEVAEEKEPAAMVQALAALKADAVLQRLKQRAENCNGIIIIGADTMVFYRDNALGKPKDEEDAFRMLSMLSGDVHEVITGVNIIIRNREGKAESVSFAVRTKVAVQPLTSHQIKEYIATGEPMDKAGAYAIQGKFGIFIKEIEGDYYNIVGFPIAEIYASLLRKGIDLKKLK